MIHALCAAAEGGRDDDDPVRHLDGPLVEDRSIVRARVAAHLGALLDRPAADVNAAAARLWQALFGVPLAELVGPI